MCESNALRFVIRYCYRKLDGKWKNFANLVSRTSQDITISFYDKRVMKVKEIKDSFPDNSYNKTAAIS